MTTRTPILGSLLVALATAIPATAAGNKPPVAASPPFDLSDCADCVQHEPRLVGTPTGSLLAGWTEGAQPPFTARLRAFDADLTGGPESSLGAAGRACRFIGTVQDITEEKRREDALHFMVDLSAATQSLVEPEEILRTNPGLLACAAFAVLLSGAALTRTLWRSGPATPP